MDLPTGLQAIMLSNLDTAQTTPTCRVRSTTTWLSWVPGLPWDSDLNLRHRAANRFIQAFGATGRSGMKRLPAQNCTFPSLSMQAAVGITSGESTDGEQAVDLDFMLQ